MKSNTANAFRSAQRAAVPRCPVLPAAGKGPRRQRLVPGVAATTKADEFKYLSQRMADVTAHFPSALAVDDFLMRVEVALCAHGFRGDNSISCTNLCRDESTGILKTKIDNIFGASFNINGLGAGLTCGCLGSLQRVLK